MIYVLVMFGDTPRTSSTVLASHRLTNHAVNTEMFFVEFPVVNKLAHGFPLLVSAAKLWDVAWIFSHGEYIKIGRGNCKYCKEDVENGMCGPCHC